MSDIVNMAGNALKAGYRYVTHGMPNVTTEQANERMLICTQCEHFNNYVCNECGCMLMLKTRMATESCPIGKWGNLLGESGNYTPSLPEQPKPTPCLPCQQAREQGIKND
jgi:hypothetical protein